MVTAHRGEIWWADLGEPRGSQPGYHRPVLIIQDDHFNHSHLATVIILSVTSNLKFQDLPGNIFLTKEDSGLVKDSVINGTQITAIDKSWLTEFVAKLPRQIMVQVENSLSLVLGL